MELGAGLEALIGATSDGIVCLDDRREVVLFNQAAVRLLGVPADMAMGRPFEDLVVPDDRPSLHALLDELGRMNLASLSFHNPFQFRLAQPSGIAKPVEATVTQTIMENGRVFTFFVQDVSERIEAEHRVATLNAELAGQLDTLRTKSERLTLLNAFSDFLQSCLSFDEAFHEVARFGRRLFPAGGTLLLIDPRRDRLGVATDWGEGIDDRDGRQDDCWAVRRGRVHVSRLGEPDRCHHLGADALPRVCVPLTARGECLGVLSLVRSISDPVPDTTEEEFLLAAADAIKLRLANLRRQSDLRDYTQRDPVTGLLKLRAFLESFRIEIDRATRAQDPLGLIVVQVTGLEQIVGAHGHDAGRTVERSLSGLLADMTYRQDTLGRIDQGLTGIVVPEGTRARTLARANEIVEAIDQLPLPYGVETRPSVAIGISLLHDHGTTAADLVEAALGAARSARQRPIGRVELAERP